MKRLFLIPLAFAALASCTQHEEGLENGPTEEATGYMTINLVTTSGSTRALSDDSHLNDYEDGEEQEYEVNSVRFYFFDKDGNPASVKSDGASYYDWTNPGDNGSDTPNVTKKLSATIVINTSSEAVDGQSDDTGVPVSIIAVVNPNTTVLNAGSYTKDALLALPGTLNNVKFEDDEPNAAVADDYYFMMTNSIYLDKDDNLVQDVPVSGHIYSSEAAAEADPVVIHVERVVAKVSMEIGTSLQSAENGKELEGGWIYKTGSVDGSGNDIYVKFSNWDVTTTAPSSYVIKKIDADWDENLFVVADGTITNNPWNWAAYCRSFWAINPQTWAKNAYNYRTYNEIERDWTVPYTYVEENAAKGAGEGNEVTDVPTQVIIAAELVNENGVGIELAEWAYNKYASQDDLKAAMLLLLDNVHKYYYEAEDGETVGENNGDTKFKKIDADHITFDTAANVDKDGEPFDVEKGRYYVYAVLDEGEESEAPEEKEETKWYELGEDGELTAVDASNVAAALKDLGHAKIWASGKTYYYFEIRHLRESVGSSKVDSEDYAEWFANSQEAGFYGVVRNHVYKCKINTLVGIGTPVYDPDEIIIPEHTEEDDSLIAAEIRILAWRVVDNGVDLEW